MIEGSVSTPLMDPDPDPGGPKTCGSGGSGSGPVFVSCFLSAKGRDDKIVSPGEAAERSQIFPVRRGAGGGGHHCLRHGHRQTGRSLCGPLGRSSWHGVILSGIGICFPFYIIIYCGSTESFVPTYKFFQNFQRCDGIGFISWNRIRISIRINFQMLSQNVWIMSLF